MSPTNLMIHSCDVLTVTYTSDASAGKVESYTVRFDALPCNIQPATPTITEEYRQRNANVEMVMFYIDGTADITAKDRIEFNGVRYRVIGEQKNLCNLDRVYRVGLVREVKQ